MYNTGSYKDLISINPSEIKKFIISSKNEKEFFNCDVGDLISLRDYLVESKKKKEKYSKLIKAPLKTKQEKNPWCIDVQPAVESPFIMKAEAKNYPSICIGYENDNFYDNSIQVSINQFTKYFNKIFFFSI